MSVTAVEADPMESVNNYDLKIALKLGACPEELTELTRLSFRYRSRYLFELLGTVAGRHQIAAEIQLRRLLSFDDVAYLAIADGLSVDHPAYIPYLVVAASQASLLDPSGVGKYAHRVMAELSASVAGPEFIPAARVGVAMIEQPVAG